MVDIKDYYGEDGSVDWGAFNKAKVDAGEICWKCDKYILNRPLFLPGSTVRQEGRQLCGGCKNLAGTESVYHEKFFRCPACGEETLVFENEYYELCVEGTHNVTCLDCEHEFEVNTTVTYSFESPARIQQEEDEEDA